MTVAAITGIVVAFCTGVGTAVAVYEFFIRRKERRPQLTIKGNPCFLPTLMPDPAHGFYCFKVTNPGERAVTLSNVQIGVIGDQSLVYPNMQGERPLPCRLEAIDSVTYWIELEPLQDQLIALGYRDEAHVTVQAHDNLGNIYESPARISLGWGR